MPGTQKLILVVDDVAANRYAVSRVLQSANYATVEAATGQDAIEQALRLHPDAIILDMNMPDQDGLVTLKQLRDNHETATVPVLFLSATAQSPSHRSRAEALGASGYLFSPVHGNTLVSVVRGIIERGVSPLS
jgi:CheY-like chemotaxis protein